jgi:hypothetical protein
MRKENPMGPVELIGVQFTGNNFTGEIIPELRNVLDKNLIRIIDLVFVRKGLSGEITVTEVNDLSDEEVMPYADLLNDLMGLLTPEDIDSVVSALPANSSVALMLFEHTWAEALRSAVLRANGTVVLREHIPNEALEAVAQEMGVPESART